MAKNLRKANLRGANLRKANLRGADLWRADLRGANLDLSTLPLHCGSFKMKVDERFIWQLICHITRLDISGIESNDVKEALQALNPYRNNFCTYRIDVQEIDEI